MAPTCYQAQAASDKQLTAQGLAKWSVSLLSSPIRATTTTTGRSHIVRAFGPTSSHRSQDELTVTTGVTTGRQ